MRNTFLPLLGALIVGGVAIAQTPAGAPPVGQVSNVQGLVTVSTGTTVDSLTNNKPIVDGSRIVTSSTGSLSLDFKDGCVVEMKPNQSTTVDSAAACPDRKNAVAMLGLGGLPLGGAGGGFFTTYGPGLLTNIAGIALVSTGGTTQAPRGGGGGQLPDISGQ